MEWDTWADVTPSHNTETYRYGRDPITCVLCTRPSKDWHETKTPFKDDEQCMICYDNNSNGCVQLRCKHQYHFTCMLQWCQTKNLHVPLPLPPNKYRCPKKIKWADLTDQVPESWEILVPQLCTECGQEHFL
jgi:hypothetical protein